MNQSKTTLFRSRNLKDLVFLNPDYAMAVLQFQEVILLKTKDILAASHASSQKTPPSCALWFLWCVCKSSERRHITNTYHHQVRTGNGHCLFKFSAYTQWMYFCSDSEFIKAPVFGLGVLAARLSPSFTLKCSFKLRFVQNRERELRETKPGP